MEPATPACLGAKGSQARPLCRTVCLRAVVRVYRAGLVAECELCSHGSICLITDPQTQMERPYHTQRNVIGNASHNVYTFFDYSAFILLHV